MKSISPLYKFSLKFSLKGGGWDEQRQPKTQPFAEIVRVVCAKCRRECDLACSRAECAKRRRECDLARARATLCGDRACRVRARVRFVRCARNPLRRSCVSSARNAGESAIWPVPAQPSAEIVRVECAKCRRECDLARARATLCGDRACRGREMQARVRFPVPAQPSAEAMRVECAKYRRECDWFCARRTLCGDRACRVREMQARVRFGPCPRNPLRRSCVSSARNAGESVICPVPAQPPAEIVRVECAKCRRDRCPRNPLRRPCASSARNTGENAIGSARGEPSAEIVRVECAKCRRECDLARARATLCGDRACRVREIQARMRFCRGEPSAEIVRVECAKCRREATCPVCAPPLSATCPHTDSTH